MGYSEVAIEASLSALMDAALVEAHDPSVGTLALAQRVAITYSGLTHLEMALFNQTFFEQMALTTLLANKDVADQIRALYASAEDSTVRLRRVPEKFAAFVLQEDEKFGRVPEATQYGVQRAVSADIQKFAGGVS